MSATVVFTIVMTLIPIIDLVVADIFTPCTKEARYVKRGAMTTKKHVNLNCIKQPDISEQFVNAIIEKLENLDLNSTKLCNE